MGPNIKLILPGDRDLKIRCEDFARKNVKAIAILADNDQRRSPKFFKEVLQACHMCGIIYGNHWWHDPAATDNFSCAAAWSRVSYRGQLYHCCLE